MRRFAYLRDPLFLTGCAAYVVNRWLVKPHVHSGFMRGHFNDLWLIPCALPPMLALHRRLGWRNHDHAPLFSEITLHLVLWSMLFEWLGPQFMPHVTGDPLDVLAYVVGGLFAWGWWRQHYRPNPVAVP